MPSELAKEDLGAILRGVELLDLYRNLKSWQRGDKLSAEADASVGAALQMELDYVGKSTD